MCVCVVSVSVSVCVYISFTRFFPSISRSGVELVVADECPTAVGGSEAQLGADGVMRYQVTLRRSDHEWGVLKRYREWRALRQLLEASVPLTRDVASRFPPRRIHLFALCAAAPGGRHDPAMINERSRRLAEWLEAALRCLPGNGAEHFPELERALAYP